MSKTLNFISKALSKFRVDKYSVSNMSVIETFLGKKGNEFNCWGASCLYYKIIDSPEWINDTTMSSVIKNRFIQLKSYRQADVNDMVAFYEGGRLIHTAVMVGKNIFFHKIGINLCTIDSLEQIKNIYSEYDSIRFYRYKSGEQYE